MPKIIDFHIHPPGPGGLSTEEQAQMAAYFRGDPPPATTEEMADYYIERDIFGVLFAIDDETVSGRPPVPNDYFADCVRRWPDTFTAFGNVDPWKGAAAVKEMERVKDLGLKGLKFHPSTQQFYPNDQQILSAVGEGAGAGADRPVSLRHNGRRRRAAGRRWHEARLRAPDPVHGRRRRRLSRN